MIVFDATPLILSGVVVIGLAVYTVFMYYIKPLVNQLFLYPLNHRRTGLTLYRFEKQVFNNRVVKEMWLKNEKEAKEYTSRHGFYPFMTLELYPQRRKLEKQ